MRERRWMQFGLALGVYTLTVLFITWPLITQLSTHIIGANALGTDSIEHIRMIWWVKYALQHGLNPAYQSFFGYPDGFFSAIQWAQPLVYWPPALLSFVVDPVAAANLWIMVILVLDGLTAFWLCLELLQTAALPPAVSTLAATLGGLIFMAFPAVQGHLLLGQLNIVSNFGLPILALSLYRIVNGRGSVRTALMGALGLWLLMVTNYTSLFYLVLPLILFGGGYWAMTHFRQMLAFRWRLIRQLAIVFGGATVLSLPFYVPLIQDALSPDHSAYLTVESAGWILFSTDPLSFLSLSPFTPWTVKVAPSFSYAILNSNMTEGTAYLGIIAVALAVIGTIRWRKLVGIWLAVIFGTMIFSLGPMLKWKEQAVVYTLGLDKSNVVLPWALFQNLPLFNLTRTPGRFNMMTGLMLAVLAALGVGYLLARVSRPVVRVAISVLLLVGVVGEYQLRFPFPTFENTQVSYFQDLAQRAGIRAVFDVPYNGTAHQSILEQTQHEKPIVAGYYARSSPVDRSKLTLLTEVASGRAWQVESTSSGFPGTPIQIDAARTILKENGIDVLIYHKANLDTPATLEWAARAFGPPAYQDAQIAAFEVPNPVQRSTDLALTEAGFYWWPYSAPESGWWPDDEEPDQDDSLWLKSGAQLLLYAPVSLTREFRFSLTPAFLARPLSMTIDGHAFHTWTVNPPADQIDFWLSLGRGFHQMQISSVDGCSYVPVVPTCLIHGGSQTLNNPACSLKGASVCVSMQVSRLQITDPAIAFQQENINLDQGLSLRGFRVPIQAARGDPLPVETDWLASQKLSGDFHLFVHVFDQNGKLIAQYDGVPNDGNFPTTQWAAPQEWNTVIPLALSPDATPGAAEVYVGWYRYPDMLRLGVHGDSKGASDGLLFLRTVQIF